MSKAIEVHNLSKAYRLGQVNTGTLSQDLNRWWALTRGKEDPFLKIGEVNDRVNTGSSNIVWSLKDINFEIEQGGTTGFIGKNGAGKSTLLKVLSRITSPSSGHIKINGRVASLLEVGTGFHPELTGRENVFLNGAILGMRKSEISRKFDIVDFSGVERYIDTPVKRYSSGMYVRLAFAVAAHLESEILIVDEVLAVGDAEFQKKCLGKMDDISKGEGRTILFVSHNMTAVNTLCENAIFLDKGHISKTGKSMDVINHYLESTSEIKTNRYWNENDAPGNENMRLISAELLGIDLKTAKSLEFNQGGYIRMRYEVKNSSLSPVPNIHILDVSGNYVMVSGEKDNFKLGAGLYESLMHIPGKFLNNGQYNIAIAITTFNPVVVHLYVKDGLTFNVTENNLNRGHDWQGDIPGVVRPDLDWKTIKIKQ